MSNQRTKSDAEQFAADYLKALTAACDAPEGEERAAVEKAVREIWDRRRHEKKAQQQQQQKKK